jgi:hypothetical protein
MTRLNKVISRVIRPRWNDLTAAKYNDGFLIFKRFIATLSGVSFKATPVFVNVKIFVVRNCPTAWRGSGKVSQVKANPANCRFRPDISPQNQA